MERTSRDRGWLEFLFTLGGPMLLARAPSSETQYLQRLHPPFDAWCLGLGGVLFLGLWVLSRRRWDPGARSWWFGAPLLLAIGAGALALTGADWLLFRRVMGLDVLAMGLVILALTAEDLQTRPQRMRTFWGPAMGLSLLAGGLAVVLVPGPLPAPFAESPVSFWLGLMTLLTGLGILAFRGSGRLEEDPGFRILVGLLQVVNGALLMLRRRSWRWGPILAVLAGCTLSILQTREIEGALEDRESDEDGRRGR